MPFSWKFHVNFTLFAGIYGLKDAESNKLCHQLLLLFFELWRRHFYAKISC